MLGKLFALMPFFNVILESMPSQQIDLYHLPQPTTPLVGRSAELHILDNALTDPKTHSVALIAAGGVGKSAITHEWLQRLLGEFEQAGTRVFAWSFYSQGAHETQTSSLKFFDEAWQFFGGEGDAPTTDEQRGRRLGALLRQQRCVLVLDGLEPLQHSIDIQRGELKDQALRALFREVRSHGAAGSLLLISSRQPVVELVNCAGYQAINLEQLSVPDGVQLLRQLGVTKGLSSDFEQAVQYGHALSLVLLGNLLRRYFNGDVRCREHLPLLFEERDQGAHACRVIEEHDKRLTEAQRVFMRMLGFFDRPMGEGEKAVLLAEWKPAQILVDCSPNDWIDVLTDLEDTGLLTCSDNVYDTHPLIRDYFSEINPEPTAHRILFEYFQQLPEKKYPDTFAELEPLYRAVHRGCLAGEYQKAGLDVYQDRILRKTEYYSLKKLGTFAADLAAISDFFPQGWGQTVQDELSEDVQNWLLGQAAFYLAPLGRLQEAVVPYEACIQNSVKLEYWINASINAGNLIDLYLALGKLSEAEATAQQAINFAVRSGELFEQICGYYYLAVTLLQQGKLSASLGVFQQAEDVQTEREPESPYLYSIQGAQYAILHLERGTVTEMSKRGNYVLMHNTGQIIDDAYGHIILALAENNPVNCYAAFEQAVAKIWQAGRIDHVPYFLLHRAQFHYDQQNYPDAWRDLTEAEEIIDNCDMQLYKVDAQLLRAHLHLQDPEHHDPEQAHTCIQHAEQGINTSGYHLRDAQLLLLKAHANPAQRQHYLDLAQQRIEEIGQYGLMPRLEKMREGLF